MEPYISKADIVREIRKRLLPTIRDKHYDEWEEAQNSERIAILDIIDTLETKDVDLEEDVDRILEEYDWNYDKIDFYEFAKHFYELGLNTRNE